VVGTESSEEFLALMLHAHLFVQAYAAEFSVVEARVQTVFTRFAALR
jgi:hypothetical protein